MSSVYGMIIDEIPVGHVGVYVRQMFQLIDDEIGSGRAQVCFCDVACTPLHKDSLLNMGLPWNQRWEVL